MRKRRRPLNAFSLVELLVVLGIVLVMTSLLISAVGGMKAAGDLTKTASDLNGVLEFGLTYAMAHNTYVWVGFFEEDPARSPGEAGTGRLIVSVVASKDGTKLYSEDVVSPPALPVAGLNQVGKLLRFDNVKLAEIPVVELARPALAAINPEEYQLGNASFAQRSGPPAVANTTTFPYPLSGTPIYQFVKIIQFSPQGDASKIVDTPTRLMEIGLRPTRGNLVAAGDKNAAVIQVVGVGGHARIYRP